MMRLLLLRHARAQARDPARPDSERPLSEDGRATARRVGAYISDQEFVPDRVLCSAARRARETLECVQSGWESSPPVRFEEALYSAGPDEILALLKTLGTATGTVMVVGHNPAVEQLAARLAREGNRGSIRRMAASFPAGALAVFELTAADWHALGAGESWLRRFVCPNDLGADGAG